jgi:hypothetical protein
MKTRESKGNCYHTSEAAFHILGGYKSGWKPMVIRMKPHNHWFLKHESGLILDLTVRQFGDRSRSLDDPVEPDYSKAKGCGFLTLKLSKKAARMINLMTYGELPIYERN